MKQEQRNKFKAFGRQPGSNRVTVGDEPENHEKDKKRKNSGNNKKGGTMKDEKKSDIEISVENEFNNRIKNLENENKKLKLQLEANNIDELKTKIGNLEKEKQTLNQKWTDSEDNLRDAIEKNNELSKQIEKLEEDNKKIVKERNTFQDGSQIIVNEKENLEKQIIKFKEEIKDLKTQLESATVLNATLQNSIKDTSNENNSLSDQLLDKNGQISKNLKCINELTEKVSFIEQERVQLQEKNQTLLSEKAKLEEEIKDLKEKASIQKVSSKREIRYNIMEEDNSEKKIKELEEIIEKYKVQVETIEKALEEGLEKYETLKTQLNSINTESITPNDEQLQLLDNANKTIEEFTTQCNKLQNTIADKDNLIKEYKDQMLALSKNVEDDAKKLSDLRKNLEAKILVIDDQKEKLKNLSLSHDDFKKAFEDEEKKRKALNQTLQEAQSKESELVKKGQEKELELYRAIDDLKDKNNDLLAKNREITEKFDNLVREKVAKKLTQSQKPKETIAITTCPPWLVGLALSGVLYSIYLLTLRNLINVAVICNFIKEKITSQITEKAVEIIINVFSFASCTALSFAITYTINALIPELFMKTIEGNTLEIK